MELDIKNPGHIAIILDGNRRFAKRLMLEPWKGHVYGKDKLQNLLNYAKDLGIREMTFYALSTENIKSRPKRELAFLYRIFREAFRDMDNSELKENEISIRFIGDLDLLPEDLKNHCLELEEKTKDNGKFIVNFAIAYGGREELISAIKKILESKIGARDLNGEVIEEYLYITSQPDMIIRTGGEKRTSNFLPWQSAYSEWFFLDKMWPEFEKEDLMECIENYKNRKRNFGK